MPKTIKDERLRWILPIINKEFKIVEVAKLCPHSKRSLERWVSVYRKRGLKALEPKSTQPKSQPHETAIRIKEEVIFMRKKTKLCSQKLHWRLKKNGINIPVRTIGKIIKQEGLTRRYRTRKIQCKYIKPSLKPGELVEIDVKYVPHKLNSRRYYQFTAIDVASRWRHLAIYDVQSNDTALKFLHEVIDKFTYPIQAIKTDNGSIFTNRYNV